MGAWSLAVLGAVFFPSLLALSESDDTTSKLINGDIVPPGAMPQVAFFVNLRTGARCTASLVGERAVVTAAHCGSNGDTIAFRLGGKVFRARFVRSPLFPSGGHDVAVGVLSESVVGIKPLSIGGRARLGLPITVAGFGCTRQGARQVFDGLLRAGRAIIRGGNARDIVFGGSNDALLCSGDSGGLAFVEENGERKILAINSRGNSRFSIDTRLDNVVSRDFLSRVALDNGITICGISSSCQGPLAENSPRVTPTPAPPIADNGGRLPRRVPERRPSVFPEPQPAPQPIGQGPLPPSPESPPQRPRRPGGVCGFDHGGGCGGASISISVRPRR